MNNASFRRKLIYIMAIIALLVPVYFLGQPKVQRKGDVSGEGSGGGTLARIRSNYNFGQADLGDIDPASESARLATLGFRGFAATILWQKAEFYKREQFWDRYAATLNQIALLQPHFINVWDHQAHNLTYNIAVEFDGYKQRYEWVKKGIDYLIRGTSYNKRQPILQWTLGIYTGQKIGIADEKKQYRELYRNDDEYHKHLISEGLDVKQSEALGADGKPDHWLSGRLWFLKAYDLVAAGHFCKKSPHLFYSDGPKCQMRFSEAIEDEGVLDDRAQFSWSRAGNQWREYGNRDLMTTWGHTIKLKGDAAAIAAAAQARSEFLAVTGPTRDKLLAKIREKLNAPEQALFDIPTERRTTEQQALLFGLNIPLEPTALEIAEACPKETREKALELATKLKNADEFISHLNSYRQQVNYEYWETRAQSEQHPTTLTARQQMYAGDKLLQEAKLDEALIQYNKAWVNWAKVFRRFPSLIADDVSGDIMKSIRRYKRILDADLPKDFPLLKFYEYKLIADKNTGEIDMNRFIDALKSKVSQLPESDNDLPNDLNDFGDVGPAVQVEAPPPPLPGGKIPKTEEERAREAGVPLPKPAIKQPVTNAPDAGAPPAPEAQPPAKESPKGTSEGASAGVVPGRPPQVENPAPIR